MTNEERDNAIRAHLAAHDAAVARKTKQLHARQDRNKRRGLSASIAALDLSTFNKDAGK